MTQRNNNPGRILKGTAIQPTLKSASGVWTINEALQAHRNNSWPQPNLFQPVANSLRLKYNANGGSFFQRIPGRNGDQRKWTYSAWVKRSLIANSTSDDFELFCGSWNNSYYAMHLNFQNSADTIQLYDWGPTGAGAFQVVTTPVYRDTNAWLHVVCAVDTTQATNTNRVKIYVNGVQVTVVGGSNNWGASSGFPNQGYATPVNGSGLPQQFGSCYVGGANAKKFDGYVSELNFIDGAQLQPTLFGQFDSNNTWVPIPYTGSYGSNGFYLPFTNAQTSQTLGYDAGLNGTTTYNADQDPYRGSVALHLTGNGPAGGQNNTFADSSPNNYTVTRTGTATQGSFSPFPLNTNTPYNPAIHGGSYYSAGTGNYITVPNSSNWAIGTTGTIEGWFYETVAADLSGTNNKRLWSVTNNTTNLDAYFTGNNIYLHGSNVGTTSANLQVNTWYHIAVVYNGGTVSIYVNGVAQTLTGTTTGWNITGTSSNAFGLGTLPGQSPFEMTGYISSFRLIKGAAVYTSNFTPMMKPFGTLTNNLLTYSEDFTNSYWVTNGVTITPNATVAPDGTSTGTLFSWNTSNTQHYLIKQTLTAVGNTVTASIYAKPAPNSSANWLIIGDTANNYMYINLLTGTTGLVSQIVNVSITGVGNGWYRISGTWTAQQSSSGWSVYVTNANNVSTLSGTDNTSGFYIWGAQLEANATLGTYTPTPANYSTAPSLLLNFANAAVVDSAGSANIVTTGASTISAFSKFGSGALYLNGSSSTYVTFPPSNNYLIGTGNFTFEGWCYLNATIPVANGVFVLATSYFPGSVTNTLALGTATSGTVWQTYIAGANQTSTATFTTNTWYHFAMVRLNATTVLYINGQPVITVSDNTNYTCTYLGLGAIYGTTYLWNGAIDDFRFTNGVARYQAAFTPPARAYPETGGKSFVTQNINAGVVKSFTTTPTTAATSISSTFSWTAPSDVTQIELLVVGGGGSGAGGNGGGAGGGGAGGLIYNNAYPVTPGQTYTVVVGGGGIASNGARQGYTGSNSQFGNLIAYGGGGGGCNILPGVAGGSGGGSGEYATPNAIGYGGAGVAGQGFKGGDTSFTGGASGGGGAGGPGINGNSGGNAGGGPGLQFGISGIPQYYAGGGGASTNSAPGGAGGSGVGGNGGPGSSGTGTVTSGANNTGSGGGGTYQTGAGTAYGGSGIVIVRYTTTAVGNTSDATTDNLVDSPTLYGHDFGLGGEVVGNYNTLNPLWSNQVNYLNGNLTVTPVTGNAGYCHFISSIAMPSTGYWYAEFTINTLPYPSGNNNMLGIVLANATANAPPIGTYFGYNSTEYSYLDAGGFRTNNTTSQTASAWAANDVIMVALGNGNVWFGRNGVWQGSGSPNPATATSPAYTGLSGNYQFAGNTYGGGYGGQISANFGQRAWQYTPPAGYQALTLKNFQRPTITPNQHFAANTWTQGTTDVTIVNTGGFQPDLVWIKSRNNAQNHYLIDSVRGATSLLRSNGASAESTGSTWVTFNSNGFVPSSANTVTNTYTYVAWQWKAGGTAVTNNVGTISAQVSANTTSGFSIITYTGNGATTATVGHGLNATPSFVLYKGRTVAAGDQNWIAMHTSLGTGNYIYLNSTNATTAFSTAFPWTSTTISANTTFNTSGATYVAYCWAETPGFSKFGTYAGNSSTDGPFIYCGFTPAMVIIKGTFSAAASQWYVYDNGRDPTSNPISNRLLLNTTDADTNGTSTDIDFVSNGFKLRYPAGGGGLNSTGSNYIYMAFAASPFGNANGTAR